MSASFKMLKVCGTCKQNSNIVFSLLIGIQRHTERNLQLRPVATSSRLLKKDDDKVKDGSDGHDQMVKTPASALGNESTSSASIPKKGPNENRKKVKQTDVRKESAATPLKDESKPSLTTNLIERLQQLDNEKKVGTEKGNVGDTGKKVKKSAAVKRWVSVTSDSQNSNEVPVTMETVSENTSKSDVGKKKVKKSKARKEEVSIVRDSQQLIDLPVTMETASEKTNVSEVAKKKKSRAKQGEVSDSQQLNDVPVTKETASEKTSVSDGDKKKVKKSAAKKSLITVTSDSQQSNDVPVTMTTTSEKTSISDDNNKRVKNLMSAAKNLGDKSKDSITSDLLSRLQYITNDNAPDQKEMESKKINIRNLLKDIEAAENRGVDEQGPTRQLRKENVDAKSKGQTARDGRRTSNEQFQGDDRRRDRTTIESNRYPRREGQDTDSKLLPRGFSRRPRELQPVNVTLFEGPRLDIFNLEDLQKTVKQEKVKETLWDVCEREELALAEAASVSNGFEEMIQWTKAGKLWKFPIDNEQGWELEQNTEFHEHIFLEQYTEDFPDKGPLRHFIDLVVVALSKNAFLTAQQKREHIQWFRNYFVSKQDILVETLGDDGLIRQRQNALQAESAQ